MKNQLSKLNIIVLVFLTLLSTFVMAEGNLLKNGSFEDYTINKDKGRWKLVEFSNWTGSGEVWNSKLGKTATNGEHKIELDVGHELNELSQIVTTVKGTKYKLSLDAYARRTNSSDFEILVDGEVMSTIKPDRKWAEYAVYFVGTGSQQVISLKELDAQNNGLGTIIDNVKLEASEEMIVNGSFEKFTVEVNNGRWKLVTFDAWDGKGEVWNNRLGKRSTKGAYKIELDVGRELNVLSQTVKTENRVEYELTLDAYARRLNSSDFEIWIDEQKLETVKPIKEWKNYSFKFFGNGETQKISIKEVESQNNRLGTVIDNISLVPTGEFSNRPPVIEGVAQKVVSVYELYHFEPKTTDMDGDSLVYSIENKPLWIDFNVTTGELKGVVPVGSEGNYSNIVISVNDGTETVSLAPFEIEVQAALDIAHKYGKATQGTDSSYYYYSSASNAIDKDDSTYNHTRGGKNGKNWLQLELPDPTIVSKVVLQNRSHSSRISNAKVYLSDRPYTGTVDESNLIETLAATTDEQVIVLDVPKSGNYLLVKGEIRSQDDRHIHLRKLEVYGQMPATPSFDAHESEYLIQGTTDDGTLITTITAQDYQEDVLSYSIVANVPFTVNALGEVSVNGLLSASSYTFDVQVSDGVNSRTTSITVNVTSGNAIEEVLQSGDVVNTLVTEEELIQAARDEIATLKNGNALLKQLYKDESISYDPGNRSQLINIVGDAHKVFPILYGNKNRVLAVAGHKENSRFAAFGAAPMEHFQDGNNESYENQFKRLLSWLIANNTDVNVSSKTIGLSFSHSDKNDIKTWIATNYPEWTIQECDRYNPDFNTCYSNVDLIITGWQTDESNTDAIRTKLSQVVTDGTPVLYLHTWYEAYNSVAHAIGDLFGFSLPYGGNYWAKDKVEIENVEAMQQAFFETSGYASIDTMFKHFQDKDYAFDWNQCKSGSNVGSQYDDCSDVVGLDSEFQEGASKVRKLMTGLDSSKKAIFDTDDYRLQKLLALIGDKLRQNVSYPMDKVNTDDTEFMKSYYSDHAVYNFRSMNPLQPDMGNFSRSNFSHITPTTKQVNLLSKKKFRSTGVYALPGQTLKVTRNDSSDLTVKVFINTLRSGATHQYEKNSGYNRPKYLQTPHFEIAQGETVALTSPYGGTIQLEFSVNDLPVEVVFESIGEHPYWASSADNDSFAQKMAAHEYDWAEVATAGFTVHSKYEKMLESIANENWGGTAAGLAQAIEQYTSNYPHVLAGFKGDGVDVVPEIHDWANTNGLTIETIDVMKHMNADQAACGYGCSGNPYDAYWAFNPIGHGDIHEMGHSLQKMRFEGFENHAATNTFAYYTKAKFFEITNGEPSCQSLPFKSVFDTVQTSVGESDVLAYLSENLWKNVGWQEPYVLKINAMMHAQKLGKLENGWHVLARVHILEREMSRAKKDWEARKASVGFSTYSLDEINSIKNNDWLTVAYSYAAGLDYRNYFDMMGIPYSQKARDQIASFGFDVVQNSLFVSTGNGYCKDDLYGTVFDRPTLDIDGNTAYSY